MSGIDWDRLTRGPWKPPTFTKADQKAALTALANLPGDDDDPNKIPTFWDLPDDLPNIGDVDFRDIVAKPLVIDGLQASNKFLKRDRMAWHIGHPGQPKNPSPFTQYPLVLDTKDGQIIMDGQHRLAALKLLGADRWMCWLLPSKL